MSVYLPVIYFHSSVLLLKWRHLLPRSQKRKSYFFHLYIPKDTNNNQGINSLIKKIYRTLYLIISFILPSSQRKHRAKWTSRFIEMETKALRAVRLIYNQMAHPPMSGLHAKSLESNKPQLQIYSVTLTRKWTKCEFYPTDTLIYQVILPTKFKNTWLNAHHSLILGRSVNK